MQVIVASLTLFAADGLVFGPLAGWIALRRQRQPIPWLILGALLGPFALLLLFLAPVGACPRCDEPVAGWPVACRVCGESLVPPLARLIGAPFKRMFSDAPRAGEAGGDADAGDGSTTHPPLTPRPIRLAANGRGSGPATATAEGPAVRSRRAGSAAPSQRQGTGGRAVAGSPALAAPAQVDVGPSWASRLSTLARGPLAPTGGSRDVDEVAPRAPGNGSSRRERFDVPVFLPPAGPFDDVNDDPTIVAAGVFVSGTEDLAIAARYAIGHRRGRLKVLGPFDINPRRVAIDWELAGLAVASSDGNVALSRRAGRRGRVKVLVFRLMGGFDADGLEAAIRAANADAGGAA